MLHLFSRIYQNSWFHDLQQIFNLQKMTNVSGQFSTPNLLHTVSSSEESYEYVENTLIEEQYNYIDQFLNKQHSSSTKNQQKSQIQIQRGQQNHQTLDHASQTSKKSVFHNFQKHLIITLKQQISKKLLKNENDLVRTIWSIFLENKQFNKSILYVIFGKNESKTDDKFYTKYGFDQIKTTFQNQQLIEAQNTLKNIILKRFDQVTIQDMLLKRKISLQQKRKLAQYIEEFISELAEGCVKKRLPKKCKHGILNGN